MAYDDLISAVRDNAGLDDAAHAERGLDLTLEELGRHLSQGAAQELATELPDRAAAAVRRHAAGQAQGGSGEDLAAAVAERMVVGDLAEAQNIVQGALRAVATTVDRTTAANVAAQLPQDLRTLFLVEEEGDTSEVLTNAPRDTPKLEDR
jgi:uncharacterized protein (DUF2267 family)